jgi:hypothetical protein
MGNKQKINNVRNIIKEEIQFQLTKKQLFENLDKKTLKRILNEEEMEAALGGAPNPKIGNTDYTANGAELSATEAKGLNGIIIKSPDIENIKNFQSRLQPSFGNPEGVIDVRYEYRITKKSTGEQFGFSGKGLSYEGVNTNRLLKISAVYDESLKKIKFDVVFLNKDFRDLMSQLKNYKSDVYEIIEELDISLPKSYQKSYSSGKFTIETSA